MPARTSTRAASLTRLPTFVYSHVDQRPAHPHRRRESGSSGRGASEAETSRSISSVSATDYSIDGGAGGSSVLSAGRQLATDTESLQTADAGSTFSARRSLGAQNENPQISDARAGMSARRQLCEEGVQTLPSVLTETDFALEAARRQTVSGSPASATRAAPLHLESPTSGQPQATGLSRLNAVLAQGSRGLWDSEADAREEEVCFSCGNQLMPDANFCRKCGLKRQVHSWSSRNSTASFSRLDGEPLFARYQRYADNAPFQCGRTADGHSSRSASGIDKESDSAGVSQPEAPASPTLHSARRWLAASCSRRLDFYNELVHSPSTIGSPSLPENSQPTAAARSLSTSAAENRYSQSRLKQQSAPPQHVQNGRLTRSASSPQFEAESVQRSVADSAESHPLLGVVQRGHVAAVRSVFASRVRDGHPETGQVAHCPVPASVEPQNASTASSASSAEGVQPAAIVQEASPAEFSNQGQPFTSSQRAASPINCHPPAASEVEQPEAASCLPRAGLTADLRMPAVATESSKSLPAENQQSAFVSKLTETHTGSAMASCRAISPHQSERSSVAGSVPSTDHAQPPSTTRSIALPDFSDHLKAPVTNSMSTCLKQVQHPVAMQCLMSRTADKPELLQPLVIQPSTPREHVEFVTAERVLSSPRLQFDILQTLEADSSESSSSQMNPSPLQEASFPEQLSEEAERLLSSLQRQSGTLQTLGTNSSGSSPSQINPSLLQEASTSRLLSENVETVGSVFVPRQAASAGEVQTSPCLPSSSDVVVAAISTFSASSPSTSLLSEARRVFPTEDFKCSTIDANSQLQAAGLRSSPNMERQHLQNFAIPDLAHAWQSASSSSAEEQHSRARVEDRIESRPALEVELELLTAGSESVENSKESAPRHATAISEASAGGDDTALISTNHQPGFTVCPAEAGIDAGDVSGSTQLFVRSEAQKLSSLPQSQSELQSAAGLELLAPIQSRSTTTMAAGRLQLPMRQVSPAREIANLVAVLRSMPSLGSEAEQSRPSAVDSSEISPALQSEHPQSLRRSASAEHTDIARKMSPLSAPTLEVGGSKALNANGPEPLVNQPQTYRAGLASSIGCMQDPAIVPPEISDVPVTPWQRRTHLEHLWNPAPACPQPSTAAASSSASANGASELLNHTVDTLSISQGYIDLREQMSAKGSSPAESSDSSQHELKHDLQASLTELEEVLARTMQSVSSRKVEVGTSQPPEESCNTPSENRGEAASGCVLSVGESLQPEVRKPSTGSTHVADHPQPCDELHKMFTQPQVTTLSGLLAADEVPAAAAVKSEHEQLETATDCTPGEHVEVLPALQPLPALRLEADDLVPLAALKLESSQLLPASTSSRLDGRSSKKLAVYSMGSSAKQLQASLGSSSLSREIVQPSATTTSACSVSPSEHVHPPNASHLMSEPSQLPPASTSDSESVISAASSPRLDGGSSQKLAVDCQGPSARKLQASLGSSSVSREIVQPSATTASACLVIPSGQVQPPDASNPMSEPSQLPPASESDNESVISLASSPRLDDGSSQKFAEYSMGSSARQLQASLGCSSFSSEIAQPSATTASACSVSPSDQVQPPNGSRLMSEPSQLPPALLSDDESVISAASSPRLDGGSSQKLAIDCQGASAKQVQASLESFTFSREMAQPSATTASACSVSPSEHAQPLNASHLMSCLIDSRHTVSTQPTQPNALAAEEVPAIAALESEQLQPVVIQPSTPREHVELVPAMRSVSSFRLEAHELLALAAGSSESCCLSQSEASVSQGAACEMQPALVAAVRSASSPRLETQPSPENGKRSSASLASGEHISHAATTPSTCSASGSDQARPRNTSQLVSPSTYSQPPGVTDLCLPVTDQLPASDAVEFGHLQPMLIRPSTPREHVELVAAVKPMSCVRWEFEHLQQLAVDGSESPSTPRQHVELVAAERTMSCIRWEVEDLQQLEVDASESPSTPIEHLELVAAVKPTSCVRWEVEDLQQLAVDGSESLQLVPEEVFKEHANFAAAVRCESSPRLEASAPQSPAPSRVQQQESSACLADQVQTSKQSTQILFSSDNSQSMLATQWMNSAPPSQPPGMTTSHQLAEGDPTAAQSEQLQLVPSVCSEHVENAAAAEFVYSPWPSGTGSSKAPPAETFIPEQRDANTIGLVSAERIQPGSEFAIMSSSSLSSLDDSHDSVPVSSASSTEHVQLAAAGDSTDLLGCSDNRPICASQVDSEAVIEAQAAEAAQLLPSAARASEEMESEAEDLSMPPEPLEFVTRVRSGSAPSREPGSSQQSASDCREPLGQLIETPLPQLGAGSAREEQFETLAKELPLPVLSLQAESHLLVAAQCSASSLNSDLQNMPATSCVADFADHAQRFLATQLMSTPEDSQPPEVPQSSTPCSLLVVPEAAQRSSGEMMPSSNAPDLSSPPAAGQQADSNSARRYELQERSEQRTPRRESCWDVLERLHLLEHGSPDLSAASCLDESSSDATCLPARLQFGDTEGLPIAHNQESGIHLGILGMEVREQSAMSLDSTDAAVSPCRVDEELTTGIGNSARSVMSTNDSPRRLPAKEWFADQLHPREQHASMMHQDATGFCPPGQQQEHQRSYHQQQEGSLEPDLSSGSSAAGSRPPRRSPIKKPPEQGGSDALARHWQVQKPVHRTALDASRVDEVVHEPIPVSLSGPALQVDLTCNRPVRMPEHHSIYTPNKLLQQQISTPTRVNTNTPPALPQPSRPDGSQSNGQDRYEAADDMEVEGQMVGSTQTQSQTARWQWPASWESIQSEPSTVWVDSACLDQGDFCQTVQTDSPCPSQITTRLSCHTRTGCTQPNHEALPSPAKQLPTRSQSAPRTRSIVASGPQARSWSLERSLERVARGCGTAIVAAPCWDVYVDRSDGSVLGINLNSTTLEVEEIRNGLIHSWNFQRPVEAVCVGDRVIEVNGKCDVSSIINECQKQQFLHLRVMHSEKSQWHGAPYPSCADVGLHGSGFHGAFSKEALANSAFSYKQLIPGPLHDAAAVLQEDRSTLSSLPLGFSLNSAQSRMPCSSARGSGALLPLSGLAVADNARETADRLMQHVAAQRELFDEIERESRRLAEQEVAELAGQANTADKDLALAAQREAVSLRSECELLKWQMWCHCILRKVLAAWRSAAPRAGHPAQLQTGFSDAASIQGEKVASVSAGSLLHVPNGNTLQVRMSGICVAAEEDNSVHEQRITIPAGRGRMAAVDSPTNSGSRCSSSGSWGGLPLPASPVYHRSSNSLASAFSLQHFKQQTPRSPCSSRRSSRQQQKTVSSNPCTPGSSRRSSKQQLAPHPSGSKTCSPCSSRRSSKEAPGQQSVQQPTQQLTHQESPESSPLVRLRRKPSIVIQVPTSPRISFQPGRSREAAGTQNNAALDSCAQQKVFAATIEQVYTEQSRPGITSAAEISREHDGASASMERKPPVMSASVRCGLANVSQAAMQACDMAAKVRGLRMATRMAQRECRESAQDLKKWSELHVEECQRSVVLQQQVTELRLSVEELRRRSPVGGSVGFVRTCSTETLSELISVPSSELPSTDALEKSLAEASQSEREQSLSELHEMHVRAEAQQVFFQAVLAAIRNIPVQSEPALEEHAEGLPSAASSRENCRQLPENNASPPVKKTLSLELPGVQPRREPGMSRGPSWASNLPELGTPKNPKQEPWGKEEFERRPRRYRSAQLLETPVANSGESDDQSKDSSLLVQQSTTLEESNVVPADLLRLRKFLEDSLAQGHDAFAAAPLAERRPSTTGSALTKVTEFVTGEVKPVRADSGKTSNSSCVPPQDRERSGLSQQTMAPELLELIGAVLVWWPKLMTSTAPEEVRRTVEQMKEGEQQWDAMSLETHERARVLREGVACGAVQPELLAALLGLADESQLREAFCAQWVASWLPPYLEEKRDKFGAAPQAETRSLLKFRTPVQQYGRQCGRVIVDGMRDLFGRVMRLHSLHSVEQEALTRLVEEFAHALCMQTEIQERFRYVVLPDEERPKDVESLEHAVFMLTYHALHLNRSMNNTNARLGSGSVQKVQTRSEFARTGSNMAGFREDFCKKMFDLIKQQPLGL